MPINPCIDRVAPEDEHLLLLHFENGEQRRFDFKPFLVHSVFERLREPAFFALVRASHGTLSWPGGIDLDPDTLYLDSVPVAQATVA